MRIRTGNQRRKRRVQHEAWRAVHWRRRRIMRTLPFMLTEALKAHHARYGVAWHRWRVRNIMGMES
jgi:hypothetical protein